MEYKNLGKEYKTDTLALYNCDCMELLRQTPDNYYELALVDPPYGIGVAAMKMGASNSKRHTNLRTRKWGVKEWDQLPVTDVYLNELFRISKNQIIFGGNYFSLPAFKHYIIWDKQMNEGMSFSDCEMAWTSFDRAQRIFRYSAFLDKKNKIHPTQKPVALYNWLLANYAKPNDKILDTHLGSGSIAIACHYAGLHLTACEIDKDYFDAAIKRINNETRQLTLTL